MNVRYRCRWRQYFTFDNNLWFRLWGAIGRRQMMREHFWDNSDSNDESLNSDIVLGQAWEIEVNGFDCAVSNICVSVLYIPYWTLIVFFSIISERLEIAYEFTSNICFLPKVTSEIQWSPCRGQFFVRKPKVKRTGSFQWLSRQSTVPIIKKMRPFPLLLYPYAMGCRRYFKCFPTLYFGNESSSLN